MKQVYLVLSYTGTLLSKIVRFYTKKEYSHVSISLDKDLKKMYSFGRLNPYNAFIGGFVHESLDYGTFKRFYKTETTIYEVDITDEQYEKLLRLIDYFEKKKELFKFNTLGLFAVPLKIKVTRKRCFYCAEFVKYVFEKTNINNDLPRIIKPEDFKMLDNKRIIYKGNMQEYRNYCV